MSIESRSGRYGAMFGDWQIRRTLGGGSGGRTAVFELYRNSSGWDEFSALKVVSLIEERGRRESFSLDRRNEYDTAMREHKAKAEQEVRLMEQLRGSFRPEFLNRLDEIIMFKPLTKDNIGNIIDLMVTDLNKRLASQDIHIELDPSAKDYIIEGGYDPVYGARPLKRFLQKNVETLAARLILSGKVGMDDAIVFHAEGGSLTADVRAAAEVVE